MSNYLCETNWFAVQTKPLRERTVSSYLACKEGLDVFFPECRAARIDPVLASREVRPLFPCYFFARFCPMVSLDVVRYARGVLRVVGNRHQLIPVSREVVDSIRELIADDGYVALAPLSWHPGDRVYINSGVLEGTRARFEQEHDDGRRVAILLESLHCARVLLDRNDLELEIA